MTASRLDARTLRLLAVEADVDPRTIVARLRGAPIRVASVRERVDRVLAAHGLSVVAGGVALGAHVGDTRTGERFGD